MKVPRKFLTILSLLLLTSSCALFKPEPVPVPVYIESSIPIRETPVGVNLYSVKTQTVSYKNLDQFLAENKRRNGNVVFIAMDVRMYENLALNFAELERYIEQQQALILYYEEQINVREETDVPETE